MLNQREVGKSEQRETHIRLVLYEGLCPWRIPPGFSPGITQRDMLQKHRILAHTYWYIRMLLILTSSLC